MVPGRLVRKASRRDDSLPIPRRADTRSTVIPGGSRNRRGERAGSSFRVYGGASGRGRGLRKRLATPRIVAVPYEWLGFDVVKTASEMRQPFRRRSAAWCVTAPVPDPHPPLKWMLHRGGFTGGMPQRWDGTMLESRLSAYVRWRAGTKLRIR